MAFQPAFTLRGPDGDPGAQGYTIDSAVIDGTGHLVLSVRSGGSGYTVDLGYVVGEPGNPGRDVDLRGSLPAEEDLPTGLGPDDEGAAYLARDLMQLFFWDGASWINAGPIGGPKGAPGDPGTPGVRGIRTYYGHGAPTGITDAAVGDQYLDVDTLQMLVFEAPSAATITPYVYSAGLTYLQVYLPGPMGARYDVRVDIEGEDSLTQFNVGDYAFFNPLPSGVTVSVVARLHDPSDQAPFGPGVTFTLMHDPFVPRLSVVSVTDGFAGPNNSMTIAIESDHLLEAYQVGVAFGSGSRLTEGNEFEMAYSPLPNGQDWVVTGLIPSTYFFTARPTLNGSPMAEGWLQDTAFRILGPGEITVALVGDPSTQAQVNVHGPALSEENAFWLAHGPISGGGFWTSEHTIERITDSAHVVSDLSPGTTYIFSVLPDTGSQPPIGTFGNVLAYTTQAGQAS